MDEDLDLAGIMQWVSNRRVMSVATSVGQEVWAAAVFYVNDGLRFYFLSPHRARHSRNIEENAQVAFTIYEDDGDWQTIRGLQLSGTASKLQGDACDVAAKLYRGKFSFVEDPKSADLKNALAKVSWYVIDGVRGYFVDNTQGLGHRIEVRSPR